MDRKYLLNAMGIVKDESDEMNNTMILNSFIKKGKEKEKVSWMYLPV